MVSGLQEINPPIAHQIDDAMLLRQPPCHQTDRAEWRQSIQYYHATFALNAQILSGNRSPRACLAGPTIGRRYGWLRLEAALCHQKKELVDNV